jgi:hypothetical protein
LGLSDRAGRGKFGSLPEIGAEPEIAVPACELCNEAGVRREEMQIAMCNALALMYWQGYRFYQNFGSRDLTWLVIGVLLAVVAMWGYSRRRRRWF